MGQYYYIVNLDKRQYLFPHKFGDGLKLLEFGCSSDGTMTALAVLLADGCGRGGGDLGSDSPLVGSWAGDRIVVTGDYADEGRFGAPPKVTLMQFIDDDEDEYQSGYEDISEKILKVLMEDDYIAERQNLRGDRFGRDWPPE